MYYRWMWSTGINRNIVECKGIIRHTGNWEIYVLIETLWNVKLGKTICEVCVAIVLIETLWNVKWKISQVYWSLRAGINRNIVECKDVSMRSSGSCVCCINRNIVECKGTKTSPFSVISFVLIETLWNVKFTCGGRSINTTRY